MSDFLTHLAERAVAPFPVVRPSVRSHFEPVAEAEITWPAASREVEARSAVLPQAGPAAALEHEPLPPPVRLVDQISRGQDASATSGAGILPAALSAPPPLHLAAVVPVASTPVPVRFAEIKASGQDARATSGAGILPAAFSSPPPMLLGAAVPVASTPLPVRFAELKGSGQNARATGRSGILPAAAPTKLPPTLSNQPPARAALPPSVAPQVTITIGRVEIRAAAMPVHPITPVVSGPPLSLETYLRRSASRTA